MSVTHANSTHTLKEMTKYIFFMILE